MGKLDEKRIFLDGVESKFFFNDKILVLRSKKGVQFTWAKCVPCRSWYFLVALTSARFACGTTADTYCICLRNCTPYQYGLEASIAAGGAHEVEHVRAKGFAAGPIRANRAKFRSSVRYNSYVSSANPEKAVAAYE